jgi:isopentenyl-diphosphate delta-isomerase
LTNQKDTSNRKADHIELAFQSQADEINQWFYYEPMLAPHPSEGLRPFDFAGGIMKAPIWVSSMTGGTALANIINKNLAKACGEFGLGMGLGSCRIILNDDTYLPDFQVRKEIGDQPLYANLGIAQIEELIDANQLSQVNELVKKLEATGLIIHVNPLQEWAQPEGDRFNRSPLETIKRILDITDAPVIVKEVGQGFGPKSMQALLDLPLQSIDFGAYGGTNFTKLEALRSSGTIAENNIILGQVGHTALEMVEMFNQLSKGPTKFATKEVIISGGVQNFLHGYFLTQKIKTNAVYGQASAFLKYAQGDYATLQQYVSEQVAGLNVASAFLTLK